jgi:hypothetical protein
MQRINMAALLKNKLIQVKVSINPLQRNGLVALKNLSLCRGRAWLPFPKLIAVSTIF